MSSRHSPVVSWRAHARFLTAASLAVVGLASCQGAIGQDTAPGAGGSGATGAAGSVGTGGSGTPQVAPKVRARAAAWAPALGVTPGLVSGAPSEPAGPLPCRPDGGGLRGGQRRAERRPDAGAAADARSVQQHRARSAGGQPGTPARRAGARRAHRPVQQQRDRARSPTCWSQQHQEMAADARHRRDGAHDADLALRSGAPTPARPARPGSSPSSDGAPTAAR